MHIFEKDMKFPLLLDTYGSVLSDRKRDLLDYYYNEDYSLSEISELTGISRQGVRDSIKKSEEEIYALESKLKIAEKNKTLSELLRSVIAEIGELVPKSDEDTANRLNRITERLSQAGALLDSSRSDDL